MTTPPTEPMSKQKRHYWKNIELSRQRQREKSRKYRLLHPKEFREHLKRSYLRHRTSRLERSKIYRLENHERYRAYDKARYPLRREADLARLKKTYWENPGARKDYNKRYQEEHKAQLAEQKKGYRERNMANILARNYEYAKRNRDKVNVWQARWREKNPGKVSANDARRRALELGAKTDKDSVGRFYEWIKNQDYVTCTYCGVFISGRSVEIDHIIPISRGGDHLPDNFCVSCKSCNASKSDFLLSEWPKCPEKFKFIQV